MDLAPPARSAPADPCKSPDGLRRSFPSRTGLFWQVEGGEALVVRPGEARSVDSAQGAESGTAGVGGGEEECRPGRRAAEGLRGV